MLPFEGHKLTPKEKRLIKVEIPFVKEFIMIREN